MNGFSSFQERIIDLTLALASFFSIDLFYVMGLVVVKVES